MSSSARFSEKTEAVMAPEVAEQSRHAPRGCRKATRGKDVPSYISTSEEIYGGTVSKCVQKMTCGVPQLKSRFSGIGNPSGRESAIVSTGNLSRRHFEVRSLSARNAANSPSLPEVESI